MTKTVSVVEIDSTYGVIGIFDSVKEIKKTMERYISEITIIQGEVKIKKGSRITMECEVPIVHTLHGNEEEFDSFIVKKYKINKYIEVEE